MKKILSTTLFLFLLLSGCSNTDNNINKINKYDILAGIDKKVDPIDVLYINNEEIEIKNTDDNTDETFIIKSDKSVYSGSDNIDVILAVTNLRDNEYGTLKLKYSKDEKINSISRYIPIETTLDTPIYEDIEVECLTKIATTTCYKTIQIGTTTQTIISDSWEDMNLIDEKSAPLTFKSNLLEKQAVGIYDDKALRYYFPKGTTFLKVNIGFESFLHFKDEFIIEIFGDDGGYGMLDPLIDDLWAYYKLDETSGTRYDETANNYDMEDGNTVGYGTGKIGNAADFERTNAEYLYDTQTTILAKTINCWVKTEDDTLSYQHIMNWNRFVDANNYDSMALRFKGKKLQYVETWRSNASTYGVHTYDGSNDVLVADTWQMVTLTVDDNASTPTTHFYVNASETSGTNSDEGGNRRTFTTAANEANISVLGDTHQFDGLIDECGIWSRILTTDEITALYNSGNGLTYPFTTTVSTYPNININLIN